MENLIESTVKLAKAERELAELIEDRDKSIKTTEKLNVDISLKKAEITRAKGSMQLDEQFNESTPAADSKLRTFDTTRVWNVTKTDSKSSSESYDKSDKFYGNGKIDG